MSCPSCWDTVTIPALFKSKNKKQNKVEDPVIKKAIRALQSQGYKLNEAKPLVTKAYTKHISLAELIKKAILNDEPTSTTKV